MWFEDVICELHAGPGDAKRVAYLPRAVAEAR